MSASTEGASPRSGWLWGALPWAVAVVFIVITAPRLDVLRPDVDEGVYIQQARLVRQGKTPCVDFFYHQTPLYLYALAGVGSVAPDSPDRYRFLSLLASALTGVLVFQAGRKLDGRSTGLLARPRSTPHPFRSTPFSRSRTRLVCLLAAAGRLKNSNRGNGWSNRGRPGKAKLERASASPPSPPELFSLPLRS